MKKVFIIMSCLLLLGFCPAIGQAETISTRLRGRILLQVESKGEAWYVNPDNSERYYLGRPADAFRIMRELGLGISNADYNKFQAKAPVRLAGKILLRVETNGEAYYVSPVDLKLYYLGRPTDAFNLMRQLGLGITNNDLDQIVIRAGYEVKDEVSSHGTTTTTTPEVATSTEEVVVPPVVEDNTTASTTEVIATTTQVILPVCSYNAEYFDNKNLTGYPSLIQTETSINYEWWTGKPAGFNYNNEFSVRWTGNCEMPKGKYVFNASYDDGMKVYVDDQLIINDWSKRFDIASSSAELSLEAGKHKIVVEYFEYTQNATAKFSWALK